MRVRIFLSIVFLSFLVSLFSVTNIDDNYVVKAGDTFLLQISSPDTLTSKTIVMPDGKINLFPIAKPMKIAGKSLGNVKSYVDSILTKQINKSFFDFNLVDISPISFTLSGAVHTNGQFVSDNPLTLSEAIEMGGGLLNSASKKIKIIHKNKGKIYDLNKFFEGNNLSQNPLINQDDFILVSFAKNPIKVYASNDTISTVQYVEIDNPMKIKDVLKKVSVKPYSLTIEKFRVKRNGLILTVDANFELLKNDSLFLGNDSAYIYVSGEVFNPKAVIFNGISNIDFYLGQSGGIKKTGSRKNIKIIHKNGVSEKYKNQKLQPGDTIYVPEKYLYTLKDFIAPVGTIITIIYTIVRIQTL